MDAAVHRGVYPVEVCLLLTKALLLVPSRGGLFPNTLYLKAGG